MLGHTLALAIIGCAGATTFGYTVLTATRIENSVNNRVSFPRLVDCCSPGYTNGLKDGKFTSGTTLEKCAAACDAETSSDAKRNCLSFSFRNASADKAVSCILSVTDLLESDKMDAGCGDTREDCLTPSWCGTQHNIERCKVTCGQCTAVVTPTVISNAGFNHYIKAGKRGTTTTTTTTETVDASKFIVESFKNYTRCYGGQIEQLPNAMNPTDCAAQCTIAKRDKGGCKHFMMEYSRPLFRPSYGTCYSVDSCYVSVYDVQYDVYSISSVVDGTTQTTNTAATVATLPDGCKTNCNTCRTMPQDACYIALITQEFNGLITQATREKCPSADDGECEASKTQSVSDMTDAFSYFNADTRQGAKTANEWLSSYMSSMKQTLSNKVPTMIIHIDKDWKFTCDKHPQGTACGADVLQNGSWNVTLYEDDVVRWVGNFTGTNVTFTIRPSKDNGDDDNDEVFDTYDCNSPPNTCSSWQYTGDNTTMPVGQYEVFADNMGYTGLITVRSGPRPHNAPAADDSHTALYAVIAAACSVALFAVAFAVRPLLSMKQEPTVIETLL